MLVDNKQKMNDWSKRRLHLLYFFVLYIIFKTILVIILCYVNYSVVADVSLQTDFK